jgi:hypothetical protein
MTALHYDTLEENQGKISLLAYSLILSLCPLCKADISCPSILLCLSMNMNDLGYEQT